jgi:hypothetical protein
MKAILQQLPQHIFHLKNLNGYREVSWAIGNLKMTKMIYSFIHLYNDNGQLTAEVLKYGKAADNEWMSGNWGDRVYRQAGHIPGWSKMLGAGSGDDMVGILANYTQQTGRIVHKDDVAILIYDFTNFKFPSQNQFGLYLEKVENYLIENYQAKHQGRKPVGNIKDEAHAKHASFVDDDHFEQLFDFNA